MAPNGNRTKLAFSDGLVDVGPLYLPLSLPISRITKRMRTLSVFANFQLST